MATDGAACDDGDRCTAGDRCVDGACLPTRSSDDSLGDFSLSYGGVGGNLVGGVLAQGDEVITLVAFPDEPPVEGARLAVGASTSGGSISLTLPPGASSGLALIRHSTRGAVLDARLVAHSPNPIRPQGVHAKPGGGHIVVGAFEGVVTLDDLEYRVSAGFDGPALFALPIGEGDTEPWFVENESIQSMRGFDTFVASESQCVLVTIVQGAQRARVFRRGTTLATFTTAERQVLSSHVGVMPQCLDAVTTRREIRDVSGGLAAVTHVVADGARLVLAASAQSSTEVGSNAGASPLTAYDAPHVLVAQVADGAVVLLSSVSDPRWLGFNPIALGLGASHGATAFAVPVVSQATLHLVGEDVPALGNPASASDLSPRALAITLDPSDGLSSQTAVLSEKEALFAALLPLPGRLQAVGLSQRHRWPAEPRISLNPEPNPGGIVFTSHDRQGLVSWLNLCRSDGSQPTLRDGATVFVSEVSGSNGVYVAGTVRGGCELGGGKSVQVPAGASAGYLVRINSDDALGCPSP